MMDLQETTWSRGSHRLWGRHQHYLLAHLLRNNHMTIRVNGALAITMMTSLLIHLSNHSPQALERNLSGRCNHQRRNENDQQRKSQRQRQMKKQKGLYGRSQ
jgi:phosphopantothenate synthetase